MEQDEITKIYETLAPMAGDYANAQAEQIGMAQQSMGPLAANTMGQSRTHGLGNYTYNRLMRPQVETMRDQLLVQGYANQLNRLLSDALSNAKRNYDRSGSGGSGGSGGGSNGGNKSGVTKITDVEDNPNDNTPSSWSYVPSSYSWKDSSGTWRTAYKNGDVSVNGKIIKGKVQYSNEQWHENYEAAKSLAKEKGWEFKDGEQ